MLELAYRWPLEKAIETSIEATAFAHKNGLEVVFFPIDFSRAELKWALDLIEKVGREGHMDPPSLRFGGQARKPAMKYFVTEVQKRIKKRLEAHFHQDFGMGVANTIMALSLGVEVMHTTVLGIGERSGNAPMEEIVMALKTMYGVDVGIDTTKLTPLANLVQRLPDPRRTAGRAADCVRVQTAKHPTEERKSVALEAVATLVDVCGVIDDQIDFAARFGVEG